jgi:predicted amidohydrolase YtcJ
VLIRQAEVANARSADVRIRGERITEMGTSLAPLGDETVLDADGGALLPGLHDHHLHLCALAASQVSLRCGPPEVRDAHALGRALAGALPPRAANPWIRGVGYHESVAGALDRDALDGWVSDRPVRIQHRSGALWMLNSEGVRRLGLEDGRDATGVERDTGGRPTGRLFRLDAWLRERLGASRPPELNATGARLAAFGVTGLTDATPGNGAEDLAHFVDAVASGALPQRLTVMGTPELPEPPPGAVSRGAVKRFLQDAALPDFDELASWIVAAHEAGRPVALHCVTRAELVLAAAVLESAGAGEGDRIEHASVAPPEVLELLRALPVTVVTQPNFIRERGDVYAKEVAGEDRAWLYRCRGFVDAAVPLGGGTDAPFGDPDPWLAMQAAVDRRTADGLELGPGESLTPERALGLFTTRAEAPGGAPRRVEVGAIADLCLLDRPWSQARERLSSECVTATLCSGRLIPRRGSDS